MEKTPPLDNNLDERERLLKEWEQRLQERERRSLEWEKQCFERKRETTTTTTLPSSGLSRDDFSVGSSSSSTDIINNTNQQQQQQHHQQQHQQQHHHQHQQQPPPRTNINHTTPRSLFQPPTYGTATPPTTPPHHYNNHNNHNNPYSHATPPYLTDHPFPTEQQINLSQWGSIGSFTTRHPAPSMASPSPVPRVINRKTKQVNLRTEEGGLSDQWKTMFFSLVNYRWHWLAILFFSVYLFSFFFFAIFYLLVDGTNNAQCLSFGEGHELLESFFFSMQTQMTIGYGRISPEAECPSLVLLVTVQSLCGLLLDCIVFGIFFARFSRPQQRAKMILFGQKAVINNRLGSKYLMIRVANVQWSHLIEARVTLLLHHSYTTHAAEQALHYQRLTLDHPSELFLGLPTIILHKIDERSPLYGITKEQLREQDFEIIAMIEGTEPTTSAIMQVLASFKPKDIFYDHYFEPVVKITDEIPEEPCYVINLENFHDATPE